MNKDSDGEIARVFSAVAEDYDRSGVDFFRVFAYSLVDRLNPQPDWHVLDVGAGRGAVVFELRDRLRVRVTAVDVAAGMVELLRADVAAACLEDVDVQQADIAELPLGDDTVDAVTASMTLFFLPDLAAGLREIRRVLRADGVLAFSVFGRTDPRWTDVYGAFLPYLPEGAGDLSRPRHPELLDPPGIHRSLESAGFREVRCEQVVHDITFESPDQWHTWSWSVGLRGVWLSIPEDMRPDARAAVMDRVRSLVDDAGLVERFEVEYVTASRQP